MGQGNSVPRVSGGIPWWLWMIGILAVLGLIFGILVSTSAPSSEQLWRGAMAHVGTREYGELQEFVDRLRAGGADADRVEVLEGVLASATKRDPKAIRVLQPYLEHDDAELRRLAIEMSAASYTRMENTARAAELYRDFIEIDPENVDVYLQAMRLYYNVRLMGPAQEMAEAVLKIDANNQFAVELLPKVLLATGQDDAAMQVYRDFLDTDIGKMTASPGFVIAYLAAQIKSGDYETARQFYEANRATVTDTRMAVGIYRHLGMLDKADEEWAAMEQKSGTRLVPGYQLIAARAAEAGETEKAIAILRRLLQEYPRTPDALAQLQELAAADGQTAIADVCAENIQQFRDLESQLASAITAIGSDMSDRESRMEIARMYAQLSYFGETEKWLLVAAKLPGDKLVVGDELTRLIDAAQGMLVPFPEAPETVPEVTSEPLPDSKSGEATSSDTDESTADSNSASADAAPAEVGSEEQSAAPVVAD